MNKGIFILNTLSILIFFSCHGQTGEEKIDAVQVKQDATKAIIQLEIAKNGEVCYQTDLALIYHPSDSLGKGQLLLDEVKFPKSTFKCCGFWVTPFIRIENTFHDPSGAWKAQFSSGAYISSKELICNNEDSYDFLEAPGLKRLNFDVTKFPNQYLRTFIWKHTGQNVLVDKVDSLWVWKQEDFIDVKSFTPVWCSNEEYTITLKSDRMAVELDIE